MINEEDGLAHPHQKGRKPCPHRKRRRGMRAFLRPSLLLMLVEGESHGYNLYDQLADYGFDCDRLDSSVVYRHLRDMEEMGLIDSHWDDDSMGPRRRVYRIQPAGLGCLEDWMEDLRQIRDQVSHLVDSYHQRMESGVNPAGRTE